MKPLSETTALVYDGGMFVELALVMARQCKRVLYQCSIEQPYPKLHEACIGDGIEGIERVRDFWDHKDEIDLFIFPDCANAGLQKELVSQGLPVWAAKAAASLNWTGWPSSGS